MSGSCLTAKDCSWMATHLPASGNGLIGALKHNKRLRRFALNAKTQRDVPTHVGAVVAVSAGGSHACAVRSDGQLVCFGGERLRTVRSADGFGSSCGSFSRRLSHMCSEIRWSVGLLWRQPLRTMRCADGFGSSCGSLSRRPSHVCSEIRSAVGLLWIERLRAMRCADGFGEQLWQSQQAKITRVQ